MTKSSTGVVNTVILYIDFVWYFVKKTGKCKLVQNSGCKNAD